MYDIKINEVQVYAYSTCGSVSAKMTTPMQQSVLELSLEQTLLDDNIVIYSGFLDESEKKFNIVIQNKRHSFDETFYIHDKPIIKNMLEKLDIHQNNKVQLYLLLYPSK